MILEKTSRLTRGLKSSILSLSIAAGAIATANAQAPIHTVYFLTPAGGLGTATTFPGSVPSAAVAITGVTAGDTLVAIDVRPQNQRLYALGVNAAADTVTLYLVAPETNVAVPVGAPSGFVQADGVTTLDIPDTDWDIDFNPTVDRLRVVSVSGLNFRMNPNTGAVVDGSADPGTNTDGAINGGTTGVGGAAYTNNQPNATATTLYTARGVELFIQNPPNNGTQNSQGSNFGLNEGTGLRGLDFAPGVNVGTSNNALTSGKLYGVWNNFLHEIDLATSSASVLKFVGSVRSIAVRTPVGAAFTLSEDGTQLRRFDTANSSAISSVGISGITAGERVVGIDGRPATGQLYGLGVNSDFNNATLYLIDPQSGAATAVGATGGISFVTAASAAVDLPDTATVGYGVDFNPVVDRMRVVTGSGLNFRINPSTGAPSGFTPRETTSPSTGAPVLGLMRKFSPLPVTTRIRSTTGLKSTP
jgi:hypothetical protein